MRAEVNIMRASREAARPRAGERGRKARGLLAGLVLSLASCGIVEPDVQATGTVRFDPIEGGCWLIQTSDATYDPVDLAEPFRVDGLRVRFEAELRSDLAHFCPGVIIEITSISAIE